MKAVQEQIPMTVYIANDGKRFFAEKDCKAYEEELNRAGSFVAMKSKVDTIECIENGPAPFVCDYVDEERYEYRWYRPKTCDEVEALNNLFRVDVTMGDGIADTVGEWVCIEIDGGYDDYTGEEDVFAIAPIDYLIERFAVFFKSLGYKVEIKKTLDAVEVRDKAVEKLWEQLEDIPMNTETECIEQPFFHFPEGSSKDEIWKWFDKHYSKGVASLVDGNCE